MRTLVAVDRSSCCRAGCGIHYCPTARPVLSPEEPGIYDYSPSAIQTGNVVQVWWCGSDDNASDRTQMSDAIEYESINLTNNSRSVPVPVLGETQYAWDSVYTCNPKVIGGSFANPLGDGRTYSYALYYVGTDSLQGQNNSIGVAFSNDGSHWKKYPKPIILPESERDLWHRPTGCL